MTQISKENRNKIQRAISALEMSKDFDKLGIPHTMDDEICDISIKALNVMDKLDNVIHDLQRESDKLAVLNTLESHQKMTELNKIIDTLNEVIKGE